MHPCRLLIRVSPCSSVARILLENQLQGGGTNFGLHSRTASWRVSRIKKYAALGRSACATWLTRSGRGGAPWGDRGRRAAPPHPGGYAIADAHPRPPSSAPPARSIAGGCRCTRTC